MSAKKLSQPQPLDGVEVAWFRGGMLDFKSDRQVQIPAVPFSDIGQVP